MAATLIAVVAALVIGHMAQSLAASMRQYDWYGNWLGWLETQLADNSFWQGRWGVVLALVPPLAVVGLFQLALREPLYGLAGLVFAVAVLFYAWGPRDLDLDVDAIINAPDTASRREAMARLWPGAAPLTIDGGALVSAVFQNALRRWFGVLFWFLVLGPCGALLYRLTVLASEGSYAHKLPAEAAEGARTLLQLLDWPVAQLLTLSLALVGNFDTVLSAWREAGGASFTLDHRFLDAAGRAAAHALPRAGRQLRYRAQCMARSRRRIVHARSPLSRRRRARQRAYRTRRGSRRLRGRIRRATRCGFDGCHCSGTTGVARRDEPGVAQPVGVAGRAGVVRDRRFRRLTRHRMWLIRRRCSSIVIRDE
jgi:AmpE protein